MAKRIRITYLLSPHWPTLTFAFIAVLGETASDLLEPWPLKIVFDYILGAKPLPQWMASALSATIGQDKTAILQFVILSIVFIAIVGALSTYAEKYLTTSVGQHVMHDLRSTLYHHIQGLSLSYHSRNRIGDLISRVTGDIDAIQDFISQALLGVAVNVLTLIGMLAIMFYLDWPFTLIALSVVPFLFTVVYVYTRRIKQASRAVRKKESEVVSVVQEVFSSIRIVKAFAREDYEQERFEQQSLESVETALRARNIKAKLPPLVQVIVAVGTCLVLWYGVSRVMAGRMTTGSLLVFLLYLGKMYDPMRSLSKMTDTISRAAVGYERISEVIGTDGEMNLPGAKRAPKFKGEIEFSHVDFAYTKGNTTLHDISFKIDSGEILALVGPTGAGKTTIASLIARFYDPLKGQVKIDGQDVRHYTLKSLREQISFVLQDTLLFHGPIWQNIAYGKPQASRDEIIRAAKLANADEFIIKMPQGYDTIVGEQGATLSGGQRQRIAIARAVIRNAPILILDEPTSDLDAASEELVLEALNELMRGKTSIVIAHRLASVRRANVILVLEDGAIVEQGTHDTLLSSGGLYSPLRDSVPRRGKANRQYIVSHTSSLPRPPARPENDYAIATSVDVRVASKR